MKNLILIGVCLVAGATAFANKGSQNASLQKNSISLYKDTVPVLSKTGVMSTDTGKKDTSNIPLRNRGTKAWRFKNRNANMTNPPIPEKKDSIPDHKKTNNKAWNYKPRIGNMMNSSDSTYTDSTRKDTSGRK